MFYPQTQQDENLLNELLVVQNKYQQKLLDGHIIYRHNSTYPRLSCSKKRGVEAGREVVSNLCDGLIDGAPISILHDIIDAKLGDNNKYNLIGSDRPISILHLAPKIPAYILSGQAYYIEKLLCYGSHYQSLVILLTKAHLTVKERQELKQFVEN